MTDPILILGDSHTNFVREGLQSLGCKVVGGQLALGPRWQLRFHNNERPLRFVVDEAQQRYEQYAAAVEKQGPAIDELDMPVVFSFSAVGRFVHGSAWEDYSPFRNSSKKYVSEKEMETALNYHFGHVLDLFRQLPYRSMNVLNPGPRSAENERGALFLLTHEWFKEQLEQLGVVPIDVTDQTCSADGALLPEFWHKRPDDKMHGNLKWGKRVAQRIVETLSEMEEGKRGQLLAAESR